MIEKKLLLAAVRNGDYTHAGETHAIDMVMSRLKKNNQQTLLDVGCGLGGTAYYLYEKGWGQITGIDIDAEVIEHAQKKYQGIEFFHCPAIQVNTIYEEASFDVIYLFNAYYSFLNQEKCLSTLSTMGKQQSTLIIFDYSSQEEYLNINPFINKTDPFFNPVNLETIDTVLNSCGWDLTELIDITPDYIIWYQQVIQHLNANMRLLHKKFGQPVFKKVLDGFLNVLKLLQLKKLGGVIIYAQKQIKNENFT